MKRNPVCEDESTEIEGVAFPDVREFSVSWGHKNLYPANACGARESKQVGKKTVGVQSFRKASGDKRGR